MDKLHIHISIPVKPPKEGNKIGENGEKKRSSVVQCSRLLKKSGLGRVLFSNMWGNAAVEYLSARRGF
jgi:hypothetical protein